MTASCRFDSKHIPSHVDQQVRGASRHSRAGPRASHAAPARAAVHRQDATARSPHTTSSAAGDAAVGQSLQIWLDGLAFAGPLPGQRPRRQGRRERPRAASSESPRNVVVVPFPRAAATRRSHHSTGQHFCCRLTACTLAPTPSHTGAAATTSPTRPLHGTAFPAKLLRLPGHPRLRAPRQ